MMRILRNLELVFGLGTVLSAAVCWFQAINEGSRVWTLHDYVFLLLIWAVCPVFVGFGCYVHVIRNKFWGFILLVVGGLFLSLAFFYILFLYAAAWYTPLSAFLVATAPSVLAVVAVMVGAAVIHFDGKDTEKTITNDEMPDDLL